MVAKFNIVILFLLLAFSKGHGQQLMGYVTLNHNEAYVGQPVQMTVSVYSSTWFTSGIDLGNIQVDGALTVFFRSVSESRQINGKQFSGVNFIYNVFPTKEGRITIPAIPIQVESPKTGGYKGIKHVIHTKERDIQVKGVPVGYNPNNWMVSSNLYISEKWNIATENVKVGDVLQRTISRNAPGTLGEFIPAVIWDTVPGISIYPKRPSIDTKKTKTYVSASRTESANYLFEKAGKVTLPRIEFMYWNYANGRFYNRIIDSITIDVAPNADLKMLAGIKEDLAQETEAIDQDEEPFLILGLTVKDFIISVLLGALGVFLCYRLLRWSYYYFRSVLKKYRMSEKYAFKEVKRAIDRNEVYPIFDKLKLWILKMDSGMPGCYPFINEYGTEELKKQFIYLEQRLREDSKIADTFDKSIFKKELEMGRKKYLRKNKIDKGEIIENSWLNPISKSK